ncbi:unnamed protein product [Rhizoctonia solani]|uniref:NodB homology domain-containing protein n=1 Tax=Rhizoctonia solani TaxID=456999 RepID=A0A8H3B5Y8_9AGAM|nr:unnamed protein product [Rhizoctonia solani]
MQFFAKLALVGTVASSLVGALAFPLDGSKVPRQLAQLVTKCTVPNTVALTFALAFPLDGSKVPRQLAQLVTKCTVPNTVALTFDDVRYWLNKVSSHAYINYDRAHTCICMISRKRLSRLEGKHMYDISKAIIAAGGKATFFVNGNNYGCIYDAANVKRIKYLHEKGHQLASHTWGHKDLATLTWDQVHDEMWRVEEALQRIIGVTPAFMRPPFGSYNDNVLAASAVRGQKVAIWDFDSGDSTGSTPAQSKQKYTDIANQRPSNILTLNHETYANCVRLLDLIFYSPVFTYTISTDTRSSLTPSPCSRPRVTSSSPLPIASASSPTRLEAPLPPAPGPVKPFHLAVLDLVSDICFYLVITCHSFIAQYCGIMHGLLW